MLLKKTLQRAKLKIRLSEAFVCLIWTTMPPIWQNAVKTKGNCLKLKSPSLITSNGDVLRIYMPIFAYMVVLFTNPLFLRQRHSIRILSAGANKSRCLVHQL